MEDKIMDEKKLKSQALEDSDLDAVAGGFTTHVLSNTFMTNNIQPRLEKSLMTDKVDLNTINLLDTRLGQGTGKIGEKTATNQEKPLFNMNAIKC